MQDFVRNRKKLKVLGTRHCFNKIADTSSEFLSLKPMGQVVNCGSGQSCDNQILPAFAKCEKSRVVAFVSGHPDKARKLSLRYGVSAKNIYNYENYGSIKDNPMANTPAECQQMIDAGKKANRKLMVAYRFRYEPYNQTAIRIARSNELGPTQMILADAGLNMGDPNQWRLTKKLGAAAAL